MAAKKKAAPKKMAARADLGAPIDGFFEKHPPPLRVTLEKLRSLIESVVPKATSSIKWGMPFYELDGRRLCALGGFKNHVNLILTGPPEAFSDPDGLLSGEGKTGRRLTLTSVDEIPVARVKQWLREAARAK